jgi:hypothetical protein
MKVLTEPAPKFTDRVFTVELTGAELALIKALTGRITTSIKSIRDVSDTLYAGNPVRLFGEDGIDAGLNITPLNLNEYSLQPWLEKINHLNK